METFQLKRAWVDGSFGNSGSLREVLIELITQGQVKIHSTAHLPKELRLVLTH